MTTHWLRALTVIAFVFATSPAHGTTFNFVAPLGLTGSQEVPPTGSPAVGTGVAHFDDQTLLLHVHLTWENLLAPAAAAHIHCCPGPGDNGPVAIDFVPAGFPNTTSGTFDNTFDLDDPASYGGMFLGQFPDVDAARDAVVAGLIDGLAYFNIHSPPPLGFPGGEIRGNIVLVPGPAPLVLLALGATALLLRRRFA